MIVQSRPQVFLNVVEEDNELTRVDVGHLEEVEDLLGLTIVEHLPASVQVELFLFLEEAICVLGCLCDEDLLSFFNTALTEKYLNLLFGINLLQNKHLGLRQVFSLFRVSS